METNKLLTLEEIEELRIVNSLTDADARADLDSLMARLLATARAYLELMDKLKKNIPMLRQWLNEDRKASPLVHSHDIAQWLEVPMEFKGYMSIADEQKIIDAVKSEDKPHLSTLKVIVEAMKEAQAIHTETARSPEDIGRAIKSLEKHLEWYEEENILRCHTNVRNW